MLFVEKASNAPRLFTSPSRGDLFVILLEEDGLILINKPAGVPTAGDTLEQPGSIQYELMQSYRRMIWAVHQLDKDTSGLNVFVRRKALVQTWTELLKRGQKEYLVMCHGTLASTLVVDAPTDWIPEKRQRGVIESGKPSKTEFRVLDTHGGFSLLAAKLHTGRTHQIRVHLEHTGHPLVGEQRYIEAPCGIAPRQMLHAWRLDVPEHTLPAAPLPDDFAATCQELGLTFSE